MDCSESTFSGSWRLETECRREPFKFIQVTNCLDIWFPDTTLFVQFTPFGNEAFLDCWGHAKVLWSWTSGRNDLCLNRVALSCTHLPCAGLFG